MAWGREEEAPESSAFATDGRAPFPPTYEDNKHIGNFSDENKWPMQKLLGRLALYEEFLKQDDLMPRAKATSERIVKHILFEVLFRNGYFNFGGGDEESSTS